MRRRHLFFLLLVAVACDRGERREPARASGAPPPPAAYDDRTRPLDERADLLVTHLAGILERQDTLALIPFVTPEGWTPDTAGAAAALDDYRRYFDGRPLAGWYRVRWRGDSAAAPHDFAMARHYELIAHGNIRKTIAVSYDAIGDRLRPWDEFLLYSPRVHRYAAAVADAIRHGDADRLARLLSPDDIDFPVAQARAGIARYDRELDRETLALRYEGLAAPRRGMRTTDLSRPFQFVIEGTSNGRAVRHGVVVRHGDGLLFWADEWIGSAESAEAR